MTPEENKVIFRRFVDEVMNGGDLSTVDALFAPDFIGHVRLPPAPPMHHEDVKALFGAYHAAFSGFGAAIEILLAEDDKVVGLLTVRGRHTGPFLGIAPTGKEVAFRTMDLFRLADGVIAEHWAMPDQFGLMQQLGAISRQSEADAQQKAS